LPPEQVVHYLGRVNQDLDHLALIITEFAKVRGQLEIGIDLGPHSDDGQWLNGCYRGRFAATGCNYGGYEKSACWVPECPENHGFALKQFQSTIIAQWAMPGSVAINCSRHG